MKTPLRSDDSVAVSEAIGPVLLPVMREAIDLGWRSHCKSRQLDPSAYDEFAATTRTNIVYDRIGTATRELVDEASVFVPGLSWRESDNRRATEVLLDPLIVIRVKRGKKKNQYRTASYPTARQRGIKNPAAEFPAGQMTIPFDGTQAFAPEDRLWVTVGFDLDEIEEKVSRVWFGVELATGYLWRDMLPQNDDEALAKIPLQLADRIEEMRRERA